MSETAFYVEQCVGVTDQDLDDLGLLLRELTHGKCTGVSRSMVNRTLSSHLLFTARMRDTRQIVGTITVVFSHTLSGSEAEIEDFVVLKEFQSCGIGQALWDAVTDLRHEGMSTISLTSKPSRTKAHRFYLRNGFEMVDTCVFRRCT